MRLIVFAVLLLVFRVGLAQNTPKIVFQADVLNRHYWRGFVFGNTPAIEPQVTLYLSTFSFNIWAAHTLDDSYSEIDLIPALNVGNYRISLLEYYNPLSGTENRFFDFSKEGNRHSGEMMVSYNGKGKMPFRWMVSTFIYGDRHLDSGKHMFSTYIQAGYPFEFAGTEVEVSAGMTPWDSYYAPGLNMIHAGVTFIDHMETGEGSWVPLKFSLFANPAKSEAWVIFSIGLARERIRKL